MMSRFAFCCIAAILLGGSFVAALHAGEETVGVVQAACTRCHTTQRICSLLGVENANGWRAIVNRMVLHGAVLSPEQATQVGDYLGSLDGSAPFCR